MITLFLEPQLDLPTIAIALLLIRIGEVAVHNRGDLDRLSHQLSWAHGGLTGVLLVIRTEPASAADLLWILLRSVLASRICLGAWAIVLFLGSELWSATIGRVFEAIRDAKLKSTLRRLQEGNARMSQILAEQERRQQRETALEWQRTAPERERQRLEAEARTRSERGAAEQAERRREEARLRSELLYQQHARQLGASFPRKRLDQFIERYLGDDATPDEVEQRERMLKQMMLDSLGTSTPVKFTAMSELAAYYQARREEIDRLPHDEEVKDTYRIQLNKQEDEALRRMLKP